MKLTTFSRQLTLATAAGLAALLSGCGTGPLTPLSAPVTTASGRLHIEGHAFGGQQPVSGATLQLLTVGTSGRGSAATNILTSPVKTDSGGSFSITGTYTCGSATQVYLLAQGGNPGLTGSNPNLAEIAALGSCATLLANASTTFIQMNELTTVGAVYALSPFMSGATNVGFSGSNPSQLIQAFADAGLLANPATGTVPGSGMPVGGTAPVAQMNTLADILAACINSTGGSAGDATPCGKLFTAATPPGGTAPTDTVTALVNIAQHPGLNVAALFNLSSATAPYQPTLSSAPTDWTLAVTYTAGGFSSPSAVAIDASGNVWIANRSGNTVTELAHSGSVLHAGAASAGGPSGIAIDAAGTAWVSNQAGNTLTHLSDSGPALGTAANGGLNAPSGIAIDPQGNLWVSNSGANAVSEFSSAGIPISSTGYTAPTLLKPLGVAISAY